MITRIHLGEFVTGDTIWFSLPFQRLPLRIGTPHDGSLRSFWTFRDARELMGLEWLIEELTEPGAGIDWCWGCEDHEPPDITRGWRKTPHIWHRRAPESMP